MKPSMQPVNLSPQQFKPRAHLFDPNPLLLDQPGLISEDQDDQDPNPNWSLAATQESPLKLIPESPLKKQKLPNSRTLVWYRRYTRK
jgi:hypothetical protein